MKFRNYKDLLHNLSKDNQIIVTISLWAYRGKRMTFKLPFHELTKYVDGDMIIKYGDYKLKFIATNGKKYSFDMYSLKIAKVDSVDIIENNKETETGKSQSELVKDLISVNLWSARRLSGINKSTAYDELEKVTGTTFERL